MLLNYLKLAFRLLLRNPFFTFINVLGLSVGFAAFLVLWQYTTSELECDQFHSEFSNKVRLAFSWKTKDDVGNVTENMIGGFSLAFNEALADDYKAFGRYTRLYHQQTFDQRTTGDHGKEIFLSHIDKDQEFIAFKEENLVYADTNLFQFFSIPLLYGTGEKVLAEPNSIVLSESMAIKHFGETDIVNSMLSLNDTIALKVTGVFEDLPSNSHLAFDAVMSIERLGRRIYQPSDGGARLYFHIEPNSNRAELDRNVDASAKKFLAPISQKLNLDPGDLNFFLQPLDEIAFSKFSGDVHQTRSRILLNVLRIVSIVILATAWINYINLIIYANRKRMKELGVRKTSGARNGDFILQFIIESLVMNALSILGAITLIQCIKVPLQNVFQVHVFSGGISATPMVIVVLIAITGIIVTGVYPALSVMMKSAKNLLTDGRLHDFYVGKSLTVFQFSVAIILLISVFAIYSQLSYILNKDLGVQRDEVIVLDLPENPNSYSRSVLNTFLTKLSALSDVKDFALSSSVPGDDNRNGIGLQRTAGAPFVGVDTNGGVDERFLTFFNIKLLAGRNFISGDSVNKHTIIVSRKALQRLGLGEPENAVGRKILVEAKEWTHNMEPAEVIGVIEDYARKPLLTQDGTGWSNEDGVVLTYHENVDAENTPQKVSLMINHEKFSETLQQVESLYKQAFSKNFAHWYFLNDNVNQHYQQEKVTRNQITLFALLAIGIACLGLLGMIANKAEEKTKEIGIRKVLGARMHQIAQILLNTTIRQIAIAAVVGVPAAHFLVQGYFQKFSDRIALQWWHYAIPVAALLIMLFMSVASNAEESSKNKPG